MLDYVEFQSAQNTLRGMLHAPDEPEPHPCVMLLHGFTGNRIEAHFLFVKIARRLRKAGIAALRFDFAGSGESDGEFEEMTTSGEVADAEAALELLRGRPAIDPARIAVAGLSLGGCVAALLAGRRGKDIKALGLLAAVGRPADAAERLRNWPDAAELPKGGLDVGGLKVRPAFLSDLASLDPAGAAGRYAGPVLIVHGTADEALPLAHAHAFRDARADSSAPTRLEIIQGAGHTFESVQHTEVVCKLLVEFFGRQL